MGGSSSRVFRLSPLRRRRRILALTMRVDEIVRITGHWEDARTGGELYKSRQEGTEREIERRNRRRKQSHAKRRMQDDASQDGRILEKEIQAQIRTGRDQI